MMFQSYINFFLLILIAIRLDILTKFGVNLFCVLSVVGMIGHEILIIEKGDENDELD